MFSADCHKQETCLTKHNGGTRPLLTLLGSLCLLAVGCEKSSRKEENDMGGGGVYSSLPLPPPREEQVVLNSISKKELLPPRVFCALVCRTNKIRKRRCQCYIISQWDWIQALFLLLISFVNLSKTLTFPKIQFPHLSNGYVNVFYEDKRRKRCKRVLIHSRMPKACSELQIGIGLCGL